MCIRDRVPVEEEEATELTAVVDQVPVVEEEATVLEVIVDQVPVKEPSEAEVISVLIY